MIARLETAPVKYPITLKEAKKQCEIGQEQQEHNTFLNDLIAMATDKAEQYLHRRLITQTWKYYLNCFPWSDHFELPFGRLQSVTSVKYTDCNSDQSTFSADDYIVDTNGDPGSVVLGYQEVWPTDTLYPVNPVEVEFICGYGLTGDNVPPAIKHAIKVSISDSFENREDYVFMPNHFNLKTWENLLFPYKLFGGIVE